MSEQRMGQEQLEAAEEIAALMEKHRCSNSDATFLVELGKIIALLEKYMDDTLNMNAEEKVSEYRTIVTIKDFSERRSNILLRLTNIKDILMATHEEAKNVWGDYMASLIQSFKDIDTSGPKKKVYDFHSELLIFRQEMQNFITTSDIGRMLRLKSQTMIDPDKVFEKAMRAIGRSHDAKWAFQLLCRYGKSNYITVEEIAAGANIGEKKLEGAMKDLIMLGSLIVECDYKIDGDVSRRAYRVPEVFRNRYWGGA